METPLAIHFLKLYLQATFNSLHADKTQLIWIGTRQQLAKLTVTELQLTNSVVLFTDMAMDLGVVLDGQLSMSRQVAAVCRSCFFQIRQLKSRAH